MDDYKDYLYQDEEDQDEHPIFEWVCSVALMVVMFAGVMLWMAIGAGQ